MVLTAALFDLDGTIVLTDDLHMAAFNQALAPHGIAVDMDYYRTGIMGRENRAILRDLLPDQDEASWDRVAAVKEHGFRRQVGALEPVAGFLDLLAWLEARAIPVAIVTNAPRANAELMLGALGLGQRLPVLVIGDELGHGKPHPLPYLEGLRRLGVAAQGAVAFEDSLSGVKSATAAGIRTFGMLTTLTEPELVGAGAVNVIRDFTDPRLWRFLDGETPVSPGNASAAQ
jgi:HAD superfamily hydrolase (TIGR01509 family)